MHQKIVVSNRFTTILIRRTSNCCGCLQHVLPMSSYTEACLVARRAAMLSSYVDSEAILSFSCTKQAKAGITCKETIGRGQPRSPLVLCISQTRYCCMLMCGRCPATAPWSCRRSSARLAGLGSRRQVRLLLTCRNPPPCGASCPQGRQPGPQRSGLCSYGSCRQNGVPDTTIAGQYGA